MTHFTITGMLTIDQCLEVIQRLPEKTNVLKPQHRNLIPGKWTDDKWSRIHKQFNTYRVRLEQDTAEYISSLIDPINTSTETLVISKKDLFYVNQYNKGDKCLPHVDPTKYTICIALNDDFEGGDFYVDNQVVKLKTGDGVIFPGHAKHKLSELSSGSRMSLCVWVF